jgi:hypothetical protein
MNSGGAKAALHALVPWWAKIAGKFALARLPVPMQAWHRIGLFAPGFMRDPDYAIRVFETHWRRAGAPAPGFTYLELGPGESLATALVAWAFGASGGTLVDSCDVAVRDIAAYRPLLAKLTLRSGARDVRELHTCDSVDSLLAVVNARVRTDGLHGLASLPSDSVDLIFSQAVLEHIPLADFAATARELHRLQRPSGIASHRIDFKDHLQASLNNLRFTETFWEQPWFARRSGFYTNRLRFSDMTATFESAGFAVTLLAQDRWDSIPLPREILAPAFRELSDSDLRTSGADILLMKTPR